MGDVQVDRGRLEILFRGFQESVELLRLGTHRNSFNPAPVLFSVSSPFTTAFNTINSQFPMLLAIPDRLIYKHPHQNRTPHLFFANQSPTSPA